MKKVVKLQYLLSMILILFMLFVIKFKSEIVSLKSVLIYVPFVLWFLIIVLFGLETKFKTRFIRMFYLIITTILSLLVTKGLEDASVAIIMFNLGYLVLMIFSLSSSTKDKKSKIKILPVGHFSLKHHRLQIVSLVLIFVLTSILLKLFSNVFQIKLIYSMIISFLIIYLFILIFNTFTNPLIKLLNKFNKDMNFSEYEKSILELINGENIHEDSRSYLMVLYVNYMYLYDKDKAINYFNSIKAPQHKKYNLYYNMIDLTNSINKLDKEEAVNKLQSFKKQYPNNKTITKIESTMTVYFTLNEIVNIKQLYPLDKGLNIQKVINAHLLMNYYKIRNNGLEAKYYAQFIMDNANDLKGIINDAKSIIETY